MAGLEAGQTAALQQAFDGGFATGFERGSVAGNWIGRLSGILALLSNDSDTKTEEGISKDALQALLAEWQSVAGSDEIPVELLHKSQALLQAFGPEDSSHSITDKAMKGSAEKD